MRKSLILVAALAVLVALAAPAAGKGKPPQEPAAVPECTTTADGLISLSGTGTIKFECLWTPEETDTDIGTVAIMPTSGAISGVVVFVRDASPGDICVLKQEGDDQNDPPYTASFALAYGDLSDDVYPDFGQFENQTYWTWNDGHWCYPQDGAMRDDPNGKPLHLKVSFRATKGTRVEIVLSPAQDTSPATP